MKHKKLHLTFIASIIAVSIALALFYTIHTYMLDLKDRYYIEGNPQSFETSYPYELFPYFLYAFIGLYAITFVTYIVSYIKREKFKQTKL